jgi:2,4-dienoyl-CoA reductase-like NADH-dependent reductase (Old Yellow Enzyme family)
MKELFESTVLKGMSLSNRFVRSATWEGLASPEGYGTEELAKCWVDLAHGKVGLIITGHAYVNPEGIAAPRQLGLYSDEHTRSLGEMIGKVHDAGGRIAVQISHGGRYALKLPGVIRLGPSTIESKGEIQCKEMTETDIRKITSQYAEAAERAKTAGSDSVQIHSGHGYLLSEFLSPFFNRRTDAYGGPVENRARFLLEVVHAVRQNVGNGFPLLVKLNSQDYLEGGFTAEDMLEVASLLQQSTVDAIEMSGGNHVTGVFGEFFPARKAKPKNDITPYYLEEAQRFKERIHIPLMLVGGIRTLEWARKIVSEGIADYTSLCRPLIREPGLIERWGSGDAAKSTCISDNGCFNPALKGAGIHCTVKGN